MAKSRQKALKTKLLGTTGLRVVGCQYHESRPVVGDTLYFEREPGNAHDPNAILVLNQDHKPVGHIARQDAAYLAPLIDGGKIMMNGEITAAEEDANDARANVEIHLCPKGTSILKPVKKVHTASDIVLEMVRKQFLDLPMVSEEVVRELQGRLMPLCIPGDRPEIWLLIRLLESQFHKKNTMGTEDMLHLLQAFMDSLTIGPPIGADGLTIFPVFSTAKKRGGMKYQVLEDAFKRKELVVSEVSEGGNVPELLVENKADSRLLILDGEELIGAKQNRIVIVALILAAHSRTVVPVSCVEQGRWNYDQRDFAMGAVAVPSVRSRARADVARSVEEGRGLQADQQQVWAQVDACLNDLDAPSATGAMHDAYDKRKRDIDRYARDCKIPAGAVGYVAAIGGEFVAADIFDRPGTLRKKWARLVRGYAVEALRGAQQGKKAFDEKDAEAVLRRAVTGENRRYAPPGDGDGINVKTSESLASVLVCDDTIVHVGILPTPVVQAEADNHQSPITPHR